MARGPNRRPLILAAALTRFRRAGFDGAAISEIAADVGVSKAAVSFHFASKEALIVELVEPMLDELEASLADQRDATWPEGPWAVAGAYFDVLVRHHDVAAWIDGDRSAQRRAGVGERLARTVEGLAAAICGGSTDPADRVRAVAAVGGIWRPIRMLSSQALVAHRDELVHAALVSYAPLDPPAPRPG